MVLVVAASVVSITFVAKGAEVAEVTTANMADEAGVTAAGI